MPVNQTDLGAWQAVPWTTCHGRHEATVLSKAQAGSVQSAIRTDWLCSSAGTFSCVIFCCCLCLTFDFICKVVSVVCGRSG